MKRNALAISLLWVAASLMLGCSKETDQSTTAGVQQAASGTSVAVAQNSSGSSSTPTNATAQNQTDYDLGNCYLNAKINKARHRGGGDAEDRRQVAQRITEVADNYFGPGVIFASAASGENNYLLLAAIPKNERSLKFFGAKNVQTIRDRAELCADGFDQVQLIIRNDDGVNQRLVRKVVLDYFEAERYMSQTHGARPE